MVDDNQVVDGIEILPLVLEPLALDCIDSMDADGVHDVVVEDIVPGVLRLLRGGWTQALAYAARQKK